MLRPWVTSATVSDRAAPSASLSLFCLADKHSHYLATYVGIVPPIAGAV